MRRSAAARAASQFTGPCSAQSPGSLRRFSRAAARRRPPRRRRRPVDMSGEDSGAVAALLEHIYTGSLPEGASATRLLPLADRYEVFDCVDDCAEALEALVLQRPAEALRALRPYQQDGRLRASWQRACDAVLADRALAMAVLSNP
mmetsp:Transcript_79043/g.245497  ORF Transcript_79043/g.245497 Transcript_79043/m.245497 type:complete len:146 (-) Transcript_79043:52-489(-)